ncbi:aldehyde dehydrogenase family protein [Nocardia vinacea]|uniref:aldehyde dehydrogenase family protein n=1 Tax=Nocardia vinacea TaxID=96468 RepID=UPI0033D6B38D
MSISTIASPLGLDPSRDELVAVLNAQRAEYMEEGVPGVAARLNRIDRFAAAVLEYADELSEALNEDFGTRSRAANLGSDIVCIVSEVAGIRANLGVWATDIAVAGSENTDTPAFIQVRPKGVVGVIGPWNFPVGLVVIPTLEALAAGNRVMIKFSDIPARTAEVFARAVASRMRPEEVVVVRGGVATASAFSDLPLDHLIFTGSPTIGTVVAEAAGRNLVPVTLELGGKNPVVVTDRADLRMAATRIAGARLVNGGQICLCPDYVFVPAARVEDFIHFYGDAVRLYFPTYRDNPTAVSIINERNFDRVNGLIEDAREQGATVYSFAPDAEGEMLPDRTRRKIAPTLLTGVTEDMAVASEEIFGPVIVVRPYSDLREVIGYINSRPSPLAAYWFGDDDADFREFLRHTTSGGVTRNDIALHWRVDGAPSGGIGRSGMGAYTGKVGFDTFSHHRTVAVANAESAMAARILQPDGGTAAAEAISGIIAQAREEIVARIASTE